MSAHEPFTERERAIADCLCEGLTSKEVGRRLGFSHHTINDYRKRLLKKAGVRNTVELVRKLLTESKKT